ncbi:MULTISPECIES: cell division protein FtsQ/DivIB [Holospora]|uniref:Cell division protein FtsQ n=2 Tax=Holospora TaxID=44747 RepID=A0A061JG22_9PROT|nr:MULTISPECIES: FtsQ-type POTRA domain-containing protein [Holospora]ETZ04806.1 cell division protein FtsQ [Holospora undulata HU1]GAJ46057.1 cell division protein FtsQ [Holospora elegans E1]
MAFFKQVYCFKFHVISECRRFSFTVKITLWIVLGISGAIYGWNFPNDIGRLLCLGGFKIEEIFIEGRKRAELLEIRRVLNLTPKQSIFGLNLPRILNDLERMPWVRSAVVERIFPNRVYVRLCEKEPIAVWSAPDKKNYLIDKEGAVILSVSFENLSKWNKLLKIVGAYAPSNVLDLQRALSLLRIHSIHEAVFLRSGRWDVYVDHKLCVKLPEGDVSFGLQRFLALRHRIPKNVKIVDLRSGDSVLMEFDKDGPPSFIEQRAKKEKNEKV